MRAEAAAPAESFIALTSPAEPRGHVFAFPFAGATAIAYHPLAGVLRRDLALWCAHSEGRHGALPPHEAEVQELAAGFAAALPARAAGIPFVLLGHSLGALLAFETARALRAAGGPQPELLVVSGRSAPQMTVSHPLFHLMPDGELVRELTSRGGFSPEVASEPSLLRLIGPTLREDLRASHEYRYAGDPVPAVRTVVLGGDTDDLAPVDTLPQWGRVTDGAEIIVLPGGHFFLWDHLDRFADTLAGAFTP